MPSRHKIEQQLTDKCFGCGQENPVGLRLSFDIDENTVRSEFTPTEAYAGYPGYVHGGIVFSILDEAMGWAAYNLSSGMLAVTAKAQVRFRRPVLTGEPLTVTASITRKTKRYIWTEANIRRKDGTLAAEGTAIMVVSEGD